MSGKKVADDDVVGDRGARVPADSDYADVLEILWVGIGQCAAINRNLLLDDSHRKANLSGDVPKLRDYLRGR